MDYEDNVFKEIVNNSVDVMDFADVPNEYIAEDIVLLIFSLIGIAANILLIYIICYFRKLHTNTNIYLINWAIADCGSAVITITFFRIFDFEMPRNISCLYVGLAFALLFNEMAFMIILTIDWCLSSFLPRPLETFRKCTKIIVAVLWVLAGIYSLTSSLLCTSVSNYYLIFHVTLPIAYFGLLVFVVVLHLIRIVQKLKNKYEYHPIVMLIVPTAFVACGFLSWINLLFFDLPTGYYLITETPVFLHPTINLVLLIVLNEDFKLCFFQVIKCPKNLACSSGPLARLFKPSPSANILESRSNGHNNEQPISFDNRTFDAANRHI